jgi:hypothetical protein
MDELHRLSGSEQVVPVGRVRRSTSGCSWMSSRGVSGAEADKATTVVWLQYPAIHPVEAINKGRAMNGSMTHVKLRSSSS